MSIAKKIIAEKILAPVAGVIAATSVAATNPPPAIVQSDAPPSVIRFDPSQRRFFEDERRVIVVNWHRQKGKDFTAAAKAVEHAIRTKQTWYIVAMTQAQADETFAKCKVVADIYKRLFRLLAWGDVPQDETEEFLDLDKEINHLFRFTSRTLHLPGGGKVVSLPGRNPDTLAGRSGNMILTEFGLYPKGGHEHWEVLFPITQRKGYKLIIISTPRGRNTKFYEVWSNPNGDYSVHTCDIVKSVFEDGYQIYGPNSEPLPQNTDDEKWAAIEALKRIYNSPSKWPREYLCQFTGDLSALIPWHEIERAAALGEGLPFDHVVLSDSNGEIGHIIHAIKSEIAGGARAEVGWDVARTGHVSAVMLNIARPNKPKHLRFAIGMKRCEYGFMRGACIALMNLQSYSVGHGDASGIGDESNEILAKMFPNRWTAFKFTAPSKRDMASALSTAFNDANQTLPSLQLHKVIATDIYAVQKNDTADSFTLEETPNDLDPDSHCDYAYGLGLGRLAGARNRLMALPIGPAKRPVDL